MSALVDVVQRSTRLSDLTKNSYSRCVGRFLGFAGAEPSGWTPLSVESWRDSLLGAGLSAQTANKHLYALRYAVKRCAALGLCHDFVTGADTARIGPTEAREAMTVDEVRALMATCSAETPQDLRDRAIMRIGLSTGLRSQNLQRLEFDQISGRRLHVIQKRGRPHSPVLDDATLEATKEWLTWLRSRQIRTGPILRRLYGQISGDWTLGQPIVGEKWLNEMLKRRARRAGIRRSIHPHLFRHTCVTWLLDAGVPPQRVMIQTGHESMATLSGYVTDLDAETHPVAEHLPEF